ncbi:MAG: 30S ribosomal protein THX, partial [Bacteroidales bacterium]
MGKGDIKTRRGKLFRGSYGRLRRRKKTRKSAFVISAKDTKPGQVKTPIDDKVKEPEKAVVEEEPKKETMVA